VSGSAKDEASTPQKLGMYSDQSIYGHLLDESPGDWTKLGFGSVLVEAQAAGKFEVWASRHTSSRPSKQENSVAGGPDNWFYSSTTDTSR
jgi:hypothetical protein